MAENHSLDRFVPGMTEELERQRRYEQRLMDLKYAFAEDPALKHACDAWVEPFVSPIGKIELRFRPRASDQGPSQAA